ncbi:hypothetical protein MQM42_18475 [Vibrio cholerae]|nr:MULTISPECIES: hypothetical protein [Vibrio]MCU8203540.1 hypothetical protein [Vibrio vulnificus]MDG6208235.1 hypothetical protein [Vibrio sp. NO3-D2]MCU4197400.1 hypothetical protein [Vibrio cholerae]MCU4201070.1 hypothetical protein [Vibrio cholerae]MCU4211524.1 hypothetical protein [Vibrio cholerae]
MVTVLCGSLVMALAAP